MLRLGAALPLWRTVCRHFEHPRVREAFSFHSLFIGGDPFRVPAIYGALVYLQFLDEVWYAREDLANGRDYLAHETLARFGCGATPPPPAEREPLLRDQIAHADALYDEGLEGIVLLPCGRRAISAAGAMYREILRQIERDGYGLQARSAIVSRKRKLLVAARTRTPSPSLSP
jgi:phytoene/squalene synthetase